MVLRKILYGLFGFVVGAVVMNTFMFSESRAQFDTDSPAKFQETIMEPRLPARYGSLVAVYDINLYFQSQDGTIYIVKPLRGNEVDTNVTVIKRS